MLFAGEKRTALGLFAGYRTLFARYSDLFAGYPILFAECPTLFVPYAGLFAESYATTKKPFRQKRKGSKTYSNVMRVTVSLSSFLITSMISFTAFS